MNHELIPFRRVAFILPTLAFLCLSHLGCEQPEKPDQRLLNENRSTHMLEGTDQDHNRSAHEVLQEARTARKQELLTKYDNVAPGSPERAEALRYAKAMTWLMHDWNPIGYAKELLKELAGAPSTEEGDTLEYRYDSGRAGTVWRFRCDPTGVIVSVELERME